MNILKRLLGSDSTPSAPDENLGSPSTSPAVDLKTAAASGDPELVKAALLGKPNVNESGGFSGFTALHSAVAGTDSAARATIVGLLHAAGADLEKKDTEKELTPLHYAAMRNKPLCLAALLSCGARVQATEGNGASALHGAAFYGFPEIVRILLEHGADPEMKDSLGNSPISLARMKGHQDLLKLFEEHLKEKALALQPATTAVNSPSDEGGQVETGKRARVQAEFTMIPPRGASMFQLLAYQGKSITYNGVVVGRADVVDIKKDGRVVIVVKEIDPIHVGRRLGQDLELHD